MAKASDFTKQRITDLWMAYKTAGGTQVTLAAAAGVKQGQISDWLSGNRTPGADGLVALAKGFTVPISSLFPPEAESLENAGPRSALVSRVIIGLATLKDDEIEVLLDHLSALVRDRESAPNLKKPTG